MVLGGNDGMGPCPIRHPQAGSKIVGIRHAVEHQQKRRLLESVEQIIERVLHRQIMHTCHHALMAMTTTQSRKTQAIGFDHPDFRFLGTLEKLPHARIASTGIDIDLNDRGRSRLEPDAHRMESEDDLVMCSNHAAIIAAPASCAASVLCPVLTTHNFVAWLNRKTDFFRYTFGFSAGIAQLVERNLAKVEVASSSLVSRSRFLQGSITKASLFCRRSCFCDKALFKAR